MTTGIEGAQHFGFRDVTKRAELFDQIAGLIRSWEMGTSINVRAEELYPATDPRITIVERRVVCNGASMDLARRPLTLKLFKAFMNKEQPYLSRDEVIAVLYGADSVVGKSRRYRESLNANAVKVISRARLLATEKLGGGVRGHVQWFAREGKDDGWWLYRQHLPGSTIPAGGGLNHVAVQLGNG